MTLGRFTTFESLESRQLLSADLSVTILSPAQGAQLRTGVEQEVLVQVANSGSERVRNVALSVFVSSDSVLDSSDTRVGGRTFSTLSAGEVDVEDVEFRISSSLTPGTYTLFAVIDSGNVIAEPNEQDNTSAGVAVTIVLGSGGDDSDDDDDSDNDDDSSNDDDSDNDDDSSNDDDLDNDDDSSNDDDSDNDDGSDNDDDSSNDDDDDDEDGVIGGPVDATVSLIAPSGSTLTLGRENRVLFIARNLGIGRIEPRVGVTLYASTDATLDTSTDTILAARGVSLEDADDIETEDLEFRLSSSFAPGNYFLFAVIDGQNAVAETDESNNTSAGVQVSFVTTAQASASRPDLSVVITSPVEGATLLTGRPNRVMILAANSGSGDSVSRPIVSLYASSDSVFSSETDTLLTTKALSSISGRESELQTIQFSTNLTAGNYTIFAVIDSANLIAESNEGNNVSAGVGVAFAPTRSASSAAPDLRVGLGLEPSDDTFRAGTVEKAFVSVANAGGGNTRRSVVRMYASDDDTLNPAEDRLLASTPVSSVASGQSATQSVSFVVPSGLQLGDYRLYASVDDDNSISESDESNNRSEAVSVSVDLGSFDLAGSVSSVRLAESVVAGDRVRGQARLAYNNVGGDAFLKGAAMGIQAFLRPVEADDSDEDVAVSAVKVESLRAGPRAAQLALDIPSTTPAGSYQLVFKLDVAGQIAEVDENNNEILSSLITIAAPFVDLAVTGATSTFGSFVDANRVARGSLTLANLGNVGGRGEASLSFSLRNAEGAETLLNSAVVRRVDVKPGKPLTIRNVQLVIPADQSGGEYTLVARAAVVNGFTDVNLANDRFDIGSITVG